jgi:hypothetical protein
MTFCWVKEQEAQSGRLRHKDGELRPAWAVHEVLISKTRRFFSTVFQEMLRCNTSHSTAWIWNVITSLGTWAEANQKTVLTTFLKALVAPSLNVRQHFTIIKFYCSFIYSYVYTLFEPSLPSCPSPRPPLPGRTCSALLFSSFIEEKT